MTNYKRKLYYCSHSGLCKTNCFHQGFHVINSDRRCVSNPCTVIRNEYTFCISVLCDFEINDKEAKDIFEINEGRVNCDEES